MDGFKYNNIFETKGIEYLVTVIFFAILIPFWIILNRQVKIKKEIQKSLGILTANKLKVPQGLFFSRLHTWTHLEKSGVAKVGLDDLLLHITGEVKFNHLIESGTKVRKGDLLAVIDHKGKLLKIYSPISGEVMESNSILTTSPELLNEDPYVKGWIFKVKPSSWVADTFSYYLAEDATTWSMQELDRFKDFLAESIGKYSPMPSNVILQDGGELVDQPLSELPDEIWQDFQEDFLSKKVLCRKANCFRKQE
jgi:glycine cleavage system H protein